MDKINQKWRQLIPKKNDLAQNGRRPLPELIVTAQPNLGWWTHVVGVEMPPTHPTNQQKLFNNI